MAKTGRKMTMIEDHDDYSIEIHNCLLKRDNCDEQWLIEWIPGHAACCRLKYDFGYPIGKVFPLARICQLHPSYQLVKEMYKAYPMAIQTLNCHHGKFQSAPRTRGKDSDQDSCSSIRCGPLRDDTIICNDDDRRGWLPLHYACKHGASFKVIRFLVARYPAAVATKTPDGWLPLHLACSAHAPLQVIQCLVSSFPRSLYMSTDQQGELPLHCACRGTTPLASQLQQPPQSKDGIASSSSSYLEVIQFLTSYGGSSMPSLSSSSVVVAGARTKQGFLPLHYACRCRAPLSVIRHLIQLHPESIKSKTTIQGTLPLHEACRYQSASADVVQYLVSRYPRAVNIPCNNGMLPLHYACQFRAHIQVIRFLVGLHPTSLLLVSNNERMLPLHMSCRHGASLQVIRYILRQMMRQQQHYDVAACKTKTKHGDLPLHLACQAFAVRSNKSEIYNAAKTIINRRSTVVTPTTTSLSSSIMVDHHHNPGDIITAATTTAEQGEHETMDAEETALAIVQELLSRYPKAARTKGSHGVRPRYLIQGNYPRVVSLLKRYEKQHGRDKSKKKDHLYEQQHPEDSSSSVDDSILSTDFKEEDYDIEYNDNVVVMVKKETTNGNDCLGGSRIARGVILLRDDEEEKINNAIPEEQHYDDDRLKETIEPVAPQEQHRHCNKVTPRNASTVCAGTSWNNRIIFRRIEASRAAVVGTHRANTPYLDYLRKNLDLDKYTQSSHQKDKAAPKPKGAKTMECNTSSTDEIQNQLRGGDLAGKAAGKGENVEKKVIQSSVVGTLSAKPLQTTARLGGHGHPCDGKIVLDHGLAAETASIKFAAPPPNMTRLASSSSDNGSTASNNAGSSSDKSLRKQSPCFVGLCEIRLWVKKQLKRKVVMTKHWSKRTTILAEVAAMAFLFLVLSVLFAQSPNGSRIECGSSLDEETWEFEWDYWT